MYYTYLWLFHACIISGSTLYLSDRSSRKSYRPLAGGGHISWFSIWLNKGFTYSIRDCWKVKITCVKYWELFSLIFYWSEKYDAYCENSNIWFSTNCFVGVTKSIQLLLVIKKIFCSLPLVNFPTFVTGTTCVLLSWFKDQRISYRQLFKVLPSVS